MRLDPIDGTIAARRAEIIAGLGAAVPGCRLIDSDDALSAYDSDALSIVRQKPLCAVLPGSTQEVSAILAWCHGAGVNVVPRGAGTSLSGGSTPRGDAVLLGLSRLNRILETDIANRCIVTQPGVTNLSLTKAVEDQGFFYAPDPSSQSACSIGGNVAENSGGLHCLKYGLTTNNLLGVECVLVDGTVMRLGGKHLDPGGLDLLGVLTGSEGMMAIITEVTVRIVPRPPVQRALLMLFPSIEAAGQCVADVIAGGITPAAMELMDRASVMAIEAHCAPGYGDAAAVLIAELDGTKAEVDAMAARMTAIATGAGAIAVRESRDEAERQKLWLGRKIAFAAIGRKARDMICMDGTIPRKRLPAVLAEINRLAAHYRLGVANVFHAGDGNLHPLILFDAMKDDELARAEAFGADILKLCVAEGGVLSGEHGIGLEKRDLMPVMFSESGLMQQQRLRCAFDADARLNPGKVFPELHACAELGRVHVREGRFRFPHLPRM